jgi:hypothetical protein
MVIITEYYDESLVLLRRHLCWESADIAYLALKVGGASDLGFTHFQPLPPLYPAGQQTLFWLQGDARAEADD